VALLQVQQLKTVDHIIYISEAYQIIGNCMAVYNTFGYGFLEVVNKDAMEIEFLQNSME
jgi:hypothetical protein